MNFFDYFINDKDINKVIKSSNMKIGSCPFSFQLMMIASDFNSGFATIFVVVPNLYEAQNYYDKLSNILGENNVLFFPSDELLSVEMISSTGDFLYERIETIITLLNNEKKVVVLSIHGLSRYEMNKDRWINSFIYLKKDDNYSKIKLINNLIKLGYNKAYTTIKTGEFSSRGEIIDIYPFGRENPIRIDFFDDDIETIKEYNPDTQRSTREINELFIAPCQEFFYDDNELKIAIDKLNEYINKNDISELEKNMIMEDISNLENHDKLNQMTRYLSLFDDKKTNILSFVNNKKVYFIDPYLSREQIKRLEKDLNDYSLRIDSKLLSNLPLFIPFEKYDNLDKIEIEGVRSFIKKDIIFDARTISNLKGNTNLILETFKSLINKYYLIISFSSINKFKGLSDFLKENDMYTRIINDFNDIKKGVINFTTKSLPSFIYKEIAILNEDIIFENNNKKPKPKFKSFYKNATKISHYDELNIGDYVVLYNYGIGIYEGITTRTFGSLKHDYIKVTYKNNAKLYEPLENINSIMKYADKDTIGVKIHNLGDGAWAREKARLRKKIHDISDKLISLYAQRLNSQGFSFPNDSPEQKDFENDFEYEVTKDQEKAIFDVKNDMEKAYPMDRLVCGDVGYGKTEVAIRACFKAVYGGKQVSILAPTTILASQHYNLFKNRMEKYGIRVEQLSRLVSTKNQKIILDDLKKGAIDVVIGTHRLLSDDVIYKDLGLLIIDEEQRFGVSHKEKIKNLKINVDCLTLSATPIPRTLQMSLMGIRDLSMIETPPKNRYPVQTYVLERNDNMISEAINRELIRGGQVFYLYNNTIDIMDIKAHLERLVPNAKICVGHGKLSKDKLEDVISSFIDKKYDVLLCTTIIESGIDMPDTNTLIVHDADRLGLSQMYQIRGRVGRSNRIAYCYLMYDENKILTKEARTRLDTIKEFNELGSGFKIAMRDLSIRGSGDILGSEQSGFIETVGIDMYKKILDEEISKSKNGDENDDIIEEKEEDIIDASLRTPMVSETVSDKYIDNDHERILIHQRIDSIKSIKNLNELEEELIDRFGPISDELYAFMYEKLSMHFAKSFGIYRIIKNEPGKLIYLIDKKKALVYDGVLMFNEALRRNILLQTKNDDLRIIFTKYKNDKETFENIALYFNLILNNTN